MSLRRLANVFMGAGLTLGTLAGLGWVLDLVPELPPAVLKLILYKLVFIGALGLIGFGALLGRVSLRLEQRERGSVGRAPDERRALPEPPMGDPAVRSRETARERR